MHNFTPLPKEELKVNISETDNRGRTCIHRAIFKDILEVIQGFDTYETRNRTLNLKTAKLKSVLKQV